MNHRTRQIDLLYLVRPKAVIRHVDIALEGTQSAKVANAPAGQHYLVAGLVTRVIRCLDRAGKIDSRHMRIVPHQTTTRTDAKPVLVVHRRVLHGNCHIALGQLVLGDLLDRRAGLALFVLLNH